MPFQTVDQTQITYTALSDDTDYIYNLQYTANGSQAYGLSLQAVYVNTDTIDSTIQLQASNNGVDFDDISGLTVDISEDGSTLWDLGTPNFHYLRVHTTFVSGSMDLTLKFHAVNGD